MPLDQRLRTRNYSSMPQGLQLVSCLCQWGNNSPAPGRAHGHSYFITSSTNFTAVRLSVTISQPLVTLTKRAHRSRLPRFLQVEHGCLERSLAFTRYSFTLRLLFTKQLSLYCPSHLHCPHGCNTIALLLHNMQPPSDPPFSLHTPYNIVHCNIL